MLPKHVNNNIKNELFQNEINWEEGETIKQEWDYVWI